MDLGAQAANSKRQQTESEIIFSLTKALENCDVQEVKRLSSSTQLEQGWLHKALEMDHGDEATNNLIEILSILKKSGQDVNYMNS